MNDAIPPKAAFHFALGDQIILNVATPQQLRNWIDAEEALWIWLGKLKAPPSYPLKVARNLMYGRRASPEPPDWSGYFSQKNPPEAPEVLIGRRVSGNIAGAKNSPPPATRKSSALTTRRG